WVCVSDRNLERNQMQLAKSPLGHYLVHNEPAGLLIIGDEVLDSGGDAVGLDCIDVGGSEFAAKEWVVAGEGFKVAASERRSVKADWEEISGFFGIRLLFPPGTNA